MHFLRIVAHGASMTRARASAGISDRGGRKIPEGGTTLRRVYMKKFRPVWLQEEKELKMVGNSYKNAIWALLVFLSVHISEVDVL